MTPGEHLELLRIEGHRLAAMPVEALDLPVPTVPGWTLERVVRHTGRVHRWVRAVLAAGPVATLDEPVTVQSLPHGPACLPAYREALEALLADLAGYGADREAPTLVGSGTVRFWMRRQAHEVAVHRVDAADAVHAAGGPAPDPFAPTAAADGVDEWARVMLARVLPAGSVPESLRGRTVHLRGTDTDNAEWLLRFGADGVRVETGQSRADVVVHGRAQELMLTAWRRRPLAALEVSGDVEVARAMLDAARI
ncbi:maleylpyruvate isomerase N-terminal domain-containing protein [Rhodococcus kronopolitis]|uniref:Maleylpyruvate isomerase N-terminal domain-containing protein n=1 Tax=Rhodococcus kronopolitis TaxID=1460226 RepID=A0ABV9FYP9_9NOCA